MGERELIDLLKKGDSSAIKILFREFHSTLCFLAYRIVKDEDTAKDMVQDVFIKLWKNRQSLQINTSLKAYLRRAVVNTSLNHLQSQARFKNQDSEAYPNSIHENVIQQKMEFDELSIKAEKAIQELPARTRTVFTLIRSEEMSYREVAETLEISLKAVEKEMMKALKLLREALKEYLPSILLAAFCLH